MSVAVADYVSGLTGGFWRQAAPAAPTLAVTASGTTATATITGANAAATVTLYYWRAGDSGWTTGNSRTGNGTIAQVGLSAGWRYTFIAVAVVDGLASAPSNQVTLLLVASGLSIIERIAADVASSLAELIAAGHASVVDRPRRMEVPDRPQHKALYIIQGSPVEMPGQEHGTKWWTADFGVYCIVRPSDASTDAVDTHINEIRSRVEAKLLEDRQRSGYAVDTIIRDPLVFQRGEEYGGVVVNFDVTYATREEDPYTQGP